MSVSSFAQGGLLGGVGSSLQNNNWRLDGNDNVDANNFIGTTTNNPLIFKTNDVERMRLTSNGQLLFPALAGNGTGLLWFNNNGALRPKYYTNDSTYYLSAAGDWKQTLWLENTNEIGRLVGNVGIGTTAPTSKLHVVGNTLLDGELYGLGLATLEQLIINTTATVQQDLNVNNNLNVTEQTTTNTLNVGGDAVIVGNVTAANAGFQSTETTALKVGSNSTAGEVLTSDDSGNATWQAIPDDNDWQQSNGNAHRTNGNVGIGTTNPTEKLDVAGRINLSGTGAGQRVIKTTDGELCIGAEEGVDIIIDNNADSQNNANFRVAKAPVGFGDGGGLGANDVLLQVKENGETVVEDLTIDRLADATATSNGVLGINANGNVMRLGNEFQPNWAKNGNNISNNNSGNVGIGTSSPAQTLDVRGDVEIGGGAADEDGSAEFLKINGQSEQWYLGVKNTGSAPSSDFHIGLSQSNDGIFHIQPDGNIGIGTTSPSEKLEVAGTIKAENFEITGTIETNGDATFTGSLKLTNLEDPSKADNRILMINPLGQIVAGISPLINPACSLYKPTLPWRVHKSNPQSIFICSNYNKVGINNTNPSAALDIIGNTEISGKLTIGNISPKNPSEHKDYKLSVDGKIVAKKIVTTQLHWADDEFGKNLTLVDLEKEEVFVLENSHLSYVPSALTLEKNGMDIAEMSSIHMRKIEQSFIYLFELNREYKNLKEENKHLLERLDILEDKIQTWMHEK